MTRFRAIGGERSHRVGRQQSYRVQRRFVEGLSVYGIPAVIRNFNVPEKALNPVRLPDLPGIFLEPCPIQPDIGGNPVSVVEEMAEIAMRLGLCRGSVKIRVFGGKTGFRMACGVKVGAAGIRRLLPKRAVPLVGPKGEQIVKMRQMVRRIAERGFRYEFD